jgi:hypothetical protein
MPPNPNDTFDANSAAGQANGVANGTDIYGQRGLWDLSGLNNNPIINQHGLGADNPRGANVPAGDQKKYGHTVDYSLPEDAVKLPISLYSTDPKKYLQLQQRLFQGGFYGATSASSIPWGSDPTGSTYDAYKKALVAAQQAQYIGNPMTPDEIIDQAITEHQAAQATAPKPGMAIQTTDPAVLRGLVQQAAQASLGRNLSADQVNRFVEEFHAQEQAYSKQAYAAQTDQSGKSFNLTQPNATAQAQEFVDQGNPTEEGGQLLASYVGRLQQMLNGG